MAIPVKLPVFEGPLDLLLHLIEKNKIDIYDIPIAGITDQYLEYVRQMDHEDLDVTSEFLVMAATLLDIKSRMLLPREKDDETGEEEGDPREELVHRLLEYKMYKYLSEELAVYREQAGVRYFRAQKLPREVLNYRPPINYDELLGDTDLQSLQKIFGEVLRRKKSRRDPIRGGFGKIRREEISLDNKTLYIRAYLQAHPRTDFRALLESRESREEVIVTFLILLELMKTQKVHIVQDSIGGKILVEAGAPENAVAGPDAVPASMDTPEEGGDVPPEDAAPASMDTPEEGGELSEESLVSTEAIAISPASDTREDSADASGTGGEVSSVGMPLTAFHRMEIVTSVFTSEGLMPESAHEDNSHADFSSPASEIRSPIIDDTNAVFPEDFSSENSLSGDNVPVDETQSIPASEGRMSENIVPVIDTQDVPVSESGLPVPAAAEDTLSNAAHIGLEQTDSSEKANLGLEQRDASAETDSGLEQTDSSEKADLGLEQRDALEETDSGLEQRDASAETGSGPVREHFSAHLWCKDPCCRARYFHTYSGKADTGKVRPPRQWMRTRMTRLWARRFF